MGWLSHPSRGPSVLPRTRQLKVNLLGGSKLQTLPGQPEGLRWAFSKIYVMLRDTYQKQTSACWTACSQTVRHCRVACPLHSVYRGIGINYKKCINLTSEVRTGIMYFLLLIFTWGHAEGNIHQLPSLHLTLPNWRSNPQARHVAWLGTELATLRHTGWCSTH